ncbi:MAG TPA: serine/threonine-protein kinase, partial [Ktedonobacteraceae bacterium]|nr:serine/threonine-protein kinase [Ktedonobacteraceae bacterium]
MILRTIGQGGMGAVYKAQDIKRQSVCAIKEMSLSMVPPEEQDQAVANFKAEAQMLANLKHINLPSVTGYFTEGARHFLVMEYIEGMTLDEYLEHNNAPFPERRVLGWARQLCDVLDYLHSQQPPIIFRDMKPGNIMLMRNGRVKLIDFGIARFFRHASSQDTQLLGTPGFAPPEQYGKAQTDERSDIYSLAMTLFQLMTFTLSEKGFGLHDVQSVNPEISLPVARALEKATALSPEDRFQSVDAFRRALLGEGTFMFENGDQATSAEELADLCERFPEEAAEYLYAGEIESWLQEMGHNNLAQAARNIRTQEDDEEEAVELFLQAVLGPNVHIRSRTGTTARSSSFRNGRAWPSQKPAPVRGVPDITVQPRTLDFGEVSPGLSASLVLSITGDRGTFIQGRVAATEPWILLDRTSFDSVHTRVNVQVDTMRLRGSTHYSGTILVIPDEDDEEQDITVRV